MNDLEAMLGALPPARSGVNRDRVMFEAGRASGRRARRSQRGWALLSTALALISIGEGALLVKRGAPAEPPPVVAVQQTVESPKSSDALPASTEEHITAQSPEPYLTSADSLRGRLAAQVLRYGLDGLPKSVPADWGESSRSILQSHGALPDDLRKELEMGGPS
jgi:hypothetical protein